MYGGKTILNKSDSNFLRKVAIVSEYLIAIGS